MENVRPNASSSLFHGSQSTTISGEINSSAGDHNRLVNVFNIYQGTQPGSGNQSALTGGQDPLATSGDSGQCPSSPLLDPVPQGTQQSCSVIPEAHASTEEREPPNARYERHLLVEKHGFPLWAPQPHSRLPLSYRRKGVSVGDVGIVTRKGYFDFLFNICLPRGHASNPEFLPVNFSPVDLLPADISELREHDSGSCLLTSSTEKLRGLTFKRNGPEGSILVMPNGAYHVDLLNLHKFKRAVSQNAENWYRFAIGTCGREIENGELRLVTGCDKTNSWGIATYSECRPGTLTLAANGVQPPVDYTWDYEGRVEAKAGPKREESLDAAGGEEYPRDIRNQCTFLRSFTITVADDVWKTMVSTPIQESTDNHILNSRKPRSHFKSVVSRFLLGFGNKEGSINLRSHSLGSEKFTIHPATVINEMLLSEYPSAKIAISHDNDWCAVIREDETAMPDASELLSRVRQSFTCHFDEDGTVSLSQKHASCRYTEAEAIRVSNRIDDDLREERERLKKKLHITLLLLGQAESGKSTLRKQFQLMFEPSSMDQERVSWTVVIFFNVVHSLNHILSTLEAWTDAFDDDTEIQSAATDDSQSILQTKAQGNPIPDQPSPSTLLAGSIIQGSQTSQIPSEAGDSTRHSHSIKEDGAFQIANLQRRLSPLVATEIQLTDKLRGGMTVSGSGKGGVFVRSGWQARAIENTLGDVKQNLHSDEIQTKARKSDPQETKDALVRDVGRMLELFVPDIRELWHHPTVRELIANRKLELDEWSEFFLRNITRVASPKYVPTIDDILHARIQTMGVTEHIFDANKDGKSLTWRLYDVGGARGQRQSWVPYFDDANAIIFLAPVSAFNQCLEEDCRTNRIEDSMQLFTKICSNALLKNVSLILFLNKIDLLKAKLNMGLKVRNYITSFGERSNDYETVVRYLSTKFRQIHRRNSKNSRVLYIHNTSVVDTKAMHAIIVNVRDSILRSYLQSTDMY